MIRIVQIHLFPTLLFTGIARSLCFACGVAGSEMWTELFEDQGEKREAGDANAQYKVAITYLKGQAVEEYRAHEITFVAG